MNRYNFLDIYKKGSILIASTLISVKVLEWLFFVLEIKWLSLLMFLTYEMAFMILEYLFIPWLLLLLVLLGSNFICKRSN